MYFVLFYYKAILRKKIKQMATKGQHELAAKPVSGAQI